MAAACSGAPMRALITHLLCGVKLSHKSTADGTANVLFRLLATSPSMRQNQQLAPSKPTAAPPLLRQPSNQAEWLPAARLPALSGRALSSGLH